MFNFGTFFILRLDVNSKALVLSSSKRILSFLSINYSQMYVKSPLNCFSISYELNIFSVFLVHVENLPFAAPSMVGISVLDFLFSIVIRLRCYIFYFDRHFTTFFLEAIFWNEARYIRISSLWQAKLMSAHFQRYLLGFECLLLLITSFIFVRYVISSFRFLVTFLIFLPTPTNKFKLHVNDFSNYLSSHSGGFSVQNLR